MSDKPHVSCTACDGNGVCTACEGSGGICECDDGACPHCKGSGHEPPTYKFGPSPMLKVKAEIDRLNAIEDEIIKRDPRYRDKPEVLKEGDDAAD